MKQIIHLVTYLSANLAIINAQSSFIHAALLKIDDTPAPLQLGKGFNILDPFKETRTCFTKESVDITNIVSGSRKTNINVYYTNSNEQLKKLSGSGYSGKVGFLRVFSLGVSETEKTETNNINDEENLVIIAKNDFGIFKYKETPVLTTDAEKAINELSSKDFVKMYGTHFISGVRKESYILLKLKKVKQIHENKNQLTNEIDGSFKFNSIAPSFEVSNTNETNTFLSNNKFTIDVEIKGGDLQKSNIIDEVTKILTSENESDKLNKIKGLLSKSIETINNPEIAEISQYYYGSFELFNLKNVYWDNVKEKKLTEINEKIYLNQELNSNLKDYVGVNSLNEWLEDFDNTISDYPKKKEQKLNLKKEFNNQVPTLKKYKLVSDTVKKYLEKLYTNCSNISCNAENSECCSFDLSFIDNLKANATLSIGKIDKIYNTALNESFEEASIPDCERSKYAILTVKNVSSNPYNFYNGTDLIKTLQAGEEYTLKIELGNFTFKASQNSGYLFYPTVNIRQVTALKTCEEIYIKVGFAD